MNEHIRETIITPGQVRKALTSRETDPFSQLAETLKVAPGADRTHFVRQFFNPREHMTGTEAACYRHLDQLCPLLEQDLGIDEDELDDFGKQINKTYLKILPQIEGNTVARFNMVLSLETLLQNNPTLGRALTPLVGQLLATEDTPGTINTLIEAFKPTVDPETLIDTYTHALTTPINDTLTRGVLKHTNLLFESIGSVLPTSYNAEIQTHITTFIEALDEHLPEITKTQQATEAIITGIHSFTNTHPRYMEADDTDIRFIDRVAAFPEGEDPVLLEIAPFLTQLAHHAELTLVESVDFYQLFRGIEKNKNADKVATLIDLLAVEQSVEFVFSPETDLVRLEEVLQEDDQIIEEIITLMTKANDTYRLQIGMICAAVPLDTMAPRFQEIFEEKYHPLETDNEFELTPFYKRWELCNESEDEMHAAIQKNGVIAIDDHLLLKMKGRMTALCTESFTTKEGKLFIAGNWYSPTKKNATARETIKVDFFDNKGRTSGKGTSWAIMRDSNFEQSNDKALEELQNIVAQTPQRYPNNAIFIGRVPLTREQYREKYKESHS